MSDQEKQETQKTIVTFAAGLMVGGLLVWIFGGSPKADAPAKETTQATTIVATTTKESDKTAATQTTTTETAKTAKPKEVSMVTGEGKIEVATQKAGSAVALKSAVYPSEEGWIGVRDYVNGQATGLLGVARYSKSQGLLPETVQLQRATVAGKEYALVFYKESGDRVFSLTEDTQIGGVVATFKAE